MNNLRNPRIAAIMALMLGPIFGMCYLNRGRMALAYLGAMIGLSLLFLLAFQYDVISIRPLGSILMALAVLHMIGVFHCYRIAERGAYPQPMRWYARWYGLVALIVVPPLLAFWFRQDGFEPFHIPSASMSPNVNKGDYVYAKKFAYRSHLPERGDVVIFKVGATSFMKRIIGLPGDRVQLKDSELYINDVAVPRTLMDKDRIGDDDDEAMFSQFMETLPEGKKIKILQGAFPGPLDNTPIYEVPAHQYFVLGDNRDRSHDSRDQKAIGFIPEDHITGKAMIIFWTDRFNKLESIPIQ